MARVSETVGASAVGDGRVCSWQTSAHTFRTPVFIYVLIFTAAKYSQSMQRRDSGCAVFCYARGRTTLKEQTCSTFKLHIACAEQGSDITLG